MQTKASLQNVHLFNALFSLASDSNLKMPVKRRRNSSFHVQCPRLRLLLKAVIGVSCAFPLFVRPALWSPLVFKTTICKLSLNLGKQGFPLFFKLKCQILLNAFEKDIVHILDRDNSNIAFKIKYNTRSLVILTSVMYTVWKTSLLQKKLKNISSKPIHRSSSSTKFWQ